MKTQEAFFEGIALELLKLGFQIRLELADVLLVTYPSRIGNATVKVMGDVVRLSWASYKEPSENTEVMIPLEHPEAMDKLERALCTHFGVGNAPRSSRKRLKR